MPRKATLVQLVFMTYTVICSGAYGLESLVSTSGPGLAIAILVALPLVYAVPIALTCAELTARYPVEGGYYRWVRRAFGDTLGFTAGWLMWLTMFATTASFAVMFSNYLRYFVPALSFGGQFIVSAAVVWLAVFLNYQGITLVGRASIIVTLLISVPFGLMTIQGMSQWQFDPRLPLVNPDKPFGAAVVGGVLMAMWLYGGFEKLTVTAEEVESPARAFPIALAWGVPLCAASYVLPTVAALAATGDWRAWGDSYFVTAAGAIGGPTAAAAMAGGALISNLGLLLATILSQSRLPMALAEDGLFPAIFARRTASGVPVVSLTASGIGLTLLCAVSFSQLAAASALVQSFAYLLLYAALITLRREASPATSSTFRIPLGRFGLGVMVLPTILIVGLVLREGLFPEGEWDLRQALFDLALFASPLAFVLARRRQPAADGGHARHTATR
jgi:amino acid transporter